MNGGRFPRGAYTGASDPIGYQLYIFLLRKVSFDNRYLVATSSALLSVLTPWTYYRASRTFGLGKVPALWVWALLVWTPSLLAIYHYIMMETLLLLLDGLALWATARFLRKGGTYSFLLMGFLWTAAVLTKPSVGPLALLCGIWSWWKRRPSRRTIAIAVAMIIVMLIPQSIRSKVALGFVAPLGNPWMVKIVHRSNALATELRFYPHQGDYFHFKAAGVYDLIALSPSGKTKPFAPFSDWTIRRGREPKRAVIIVRSAYGERDWKKAYDAFQPDTAEWLAQWRENIVLFLFAPSWPEDESPIWIDSWEPPSRWIWAPLVLFVLAGNCRLFLKRRFELIPVATTCLTLFLALQNVVLFEGRYRKPVEPLLILNVVWLLATWSIPSTLHQTGSTAAVE